MQEFDRPRKGAGERREKQKLPLGESGAVELKHGKLFVLRGDAGVSRFKLLTVRQESRFFCRFS